MTRSIFILVAFGAALSVSGCANNDSLMSMLQPTETTSALPAKPKYDAACPAIASRIESLRGEGVVGRVEAASKGRSSSVQVKRASLAQMAELDKANAEFQAKCSSYPVVKSTASGTPAQAAKTSSSDADAAAVIAKAEAASKTDKSKK